MRARAVLALVLALGTPLLAWAADSEAPKKRPGRYKIGPVYLTPKLELKNAGVDTNVFNKSAGGAGDTQVVLSPGVGAVLPVGRRLRITGRGFLDLNYFQRESTERSTDRAAEGRVELDVGPFTLFGAGGGGQYKQRFSIDLDERLLRQEKWAQVGARWDLTHRISLTGFGTGRVHRYDSLLVDGADAKDTLDRNSLIATGEARIALTSLTTLFLSAEALEDRFLSAGLNPRVTTTSSGHLTAEPPGRLVQSQRYLCGFELGARALIAGRVLAGYRQFPSGSVSAPPYRGPVAAVSVTTPVLAQGRLDLSADRDVFYSASPAGTADERLRNSYVVARYGGQLTFDLPFDFIGRASVMYEQARYVLPDSGSEGSVRRADNRTTLSSSLLRRFGDNLRVGGNVAWTRRVSNVPGSSYDGLRYGLQAELIP